MKLVDVDHHNDTSQLAARTSTVASDKIDHPAEQTASFLSTSTSTTHAMTIPPRPVSPADNMNELGKGNSVPRPVDEGMMAATDHESFRAQVTEYLRFKASASLAVSSTTPANELAGSWSTSNAITKDKIPVVPTHVPASMARSTHTNNPLSTPTMTTTASITPHERVEPTMYSRKAITTLKLGHGPVMRPGMSSAWLKPVVLYDDDLKKLDS